MADTEPEGQARPAPSRSVRRRSVTRAGTHSPRRTLPRPAASPTIPAAEESTPTDAPAEESTPTDAPGEDPDSAGRRLRRWRAAVVGLSVLLAASLAATGLIARDLHDKQQVESAHQQALAAARQATVNFMSISAATVDSDIERIATGATGDFRDEFTRDAAQVRSAVTQNKVASQGTVLRTGLVSGDTRTAVVLVAIDSTVHNKSAPNGRLSHYRIRVGLAKDRQTGHWLVSQLQFVG
jgi:Mce-associated membrane protein